MTESEGGDNVEDSGPADIAGDDGDGLSGTSVSAELFRSMSLTGDYSTDYLAGEHLAHRLRKPAGHPDFGLLMTWIVERINTLHAAQAVNGGPASTSGMTAGFLQGIHRILRRDAPGAGPHRFRLRPHRRQATGETRR